MKKPDLKAHVVNKDDLWDRLNEIERETLLIRPPGSFTAMEYARKRGMNRNKSAQTLARLVELGKVKRYKVPGSNLVYFTLKK